MLSRQHITLAALLSLTPGLAFATPSKITWTKGAGTPDFVTPGNWQNGNVTLSILPDDTTSAITQFSGPADQASNVAVTHSVAGVEITADAGNVTLTGNATLLVGDSGVADNAVAGNQSISAPLDFTGNSSLITSAGSLEISGPVANNTSQGLHLGGSTTSSKLSGPISGTGDLIKDDAGSWKLNAANSYTGKTIVEGGTLQLGAAGALPNGKDLIVTPHGAASATLDVNSTNQQIGALTLGGDAGSTAAINFSSGTLTLGGEVVYDASANPGTASINGGSVNLGGSRTFNIGQSAGSTNGDVVISAAITGSGDDLIKKGAGKLVLAGNNSYSGTTVVQDGRLQLATGGVNPTGGAVTVDAQSEGGSATFDLGSTSQTIGTLTLRGLGNSTNNVDLGPTGVLTLNGDVIYDGANMPKGATISNGTAIQLGASNHTVNVGSSSNASMGELTVMTQVAGNVGLTKTGAGKLVFGADNTYSGTTTVNSGVLQIGNGANAGSVAGDLNNNAQVVFDRSDAVTYTHVISGSGSLTQNGSGKLTLAGANTFTGPITVNSGTLAISSDANLGAAPGAPTYAQLLLNNGTLEVTADTTLAANRGIGLSGAVAGVQVDGSAKLAYGGTIDGTATLDKTGTGTLELSGTNSYAGQTQVHAGTLKDTTGHAFSPSSNLAVASGATVAINGDETVEGLSDLGDVGGAVGLANGAKLTLAGGNTSFSGAISGNGSLELGNLSYTDETLTGTNTYTGGTKIAGGNTLRIGNGGTVGAIVSGAIANNGYLQFNRSDAIHYGGISGNGEVRQMGAGDLTLDAGNTYSGGTYIGAGSVTDAGAGALPTGGGVYLHGGTLNIQHNESIRGLGDWYITDYASGNVTLAGGTTLTLVNGSDQFSGNISGAGTLVLSSGSETITGNASHTGGTIIRHNGSLQIGDNGTTGAVAGDITNDGTLYFRRTDTVNYGGIHGSGDVVQEGGGNLVLSGTNAYSGYTYVDSGSLSDANAHAFSPNSVIWLYNTAVTMNADETIGGLGGFYYGGNNAVTLHGALTIRGHNNSFAGALVGNGSVTIASGASQTLAGTLAHTGGTRVEPGGSLTLGDGATTTTLAGDITDNGTVAFGPTGTMNYGGVISGSGGVTVQQYGGTIALSGANTYTGSTHIGPGTLRVDAPNALPSATEVTFEQYAAGTLDIEANQTIGHLNGNTGQVTLGAGHALTVAPSDGRDAGMFTGSITGAGALVLNAPGHSIILTGSADFTGGTTVDAGALVVGTDTALGSGQVALHSGASLLIGNSDNSDVTLSNAVALDDNVTLGGGGKDYRLGLAGQATVAGSAATVHVQDRVTIGGGLKAATGTSSVTFDSAAGGFGKAVLLGATDASVTHINANNAGVIFASSQAAAPGLTLAANSGYIGIGYTSDTTAYPTPAAAAVLNLVGNKSGFAGAIGFDTVDRYAAPHVFSDAVDLSGFGAGTTLGSSTKAVLTGTITPGANGYMFGNGGGVLFVQSALTGGNVTVASATSVPGNSLAAVFEGDNSFTGNLSVSNSIGVLDSAHALPHGRTVTLGDNGYIGFTEAFTPAASLASFIAHQLTPGGYTATSVLGLDSHQAAADTLAHGSASETRYVSDTIDLSGLNSVYLGTATGLLLSGRIIAPNQGGANKTLSLLAAGDSTLTITSSLTADNVSSVRVGSSAGYATGTVALLGTSTFGGGTTLRSGTLELQGSSHVVNGNIVAGPLGAGPLTVDPAGQKEPVLSSSAWLMLDNALSLGGRLQLGTLSETSLVLNGVIGDLGGTHGSLDIVGQAQLNGANTFTGGVNLLSGNLALGNDHALGTGTLTINGDNNEGESYLTSFNGPRTLTNPIVISGGNSQNIYIEGNFTLNGALTLNAATTVYLENNQTLTLNGPVAGPAPLTMGYGTVVLTPTAPTTASGGLTSDDGVLILGNANAMPASPVTNAFASNYDGYLGIGFVPGNLQTDFIDRFDKGQTDGAIGFDSASVGSPNTFNTPINLQGFTNTTRLGSATSAILGAAATITPQDATYRFGNGGGLLRVDAALTDSGGDTRNLDVESFDRAPLTLRLTGANTYTGGTYVYASALIFGTNALPAQGAFGGEYGYIGTEDPSLASNPAAFVNRFTTSNSRMIMGFDSPTTTPAAVTGDISLADVSDADRYIGTATSATISGNITLPSGQSTYHFAGFKGGQLTVATSLTGDTGVVIGDEYNSGTFGNPMIPGSPLSRVTLTGANTYTGSTNLYAGELFAGNANAFGTGPVILGTENSIDGRHLGLSASVSGITIANNIALGYEMLDVGAGDASFGLSGALAGETYSTLYKVGAGTLTLSGNNTVFAGNVVVQGGGLIFAPAATGNSFGSGSLTFDSPAASTATFQDNAVVNGIEDDNGTGTIALTGGKTFTINQIHDTTFNGSITGSTAGLTLKGSGYQLRLGGDNTYVGPTTVQSGMVVAGSATAFGNAANAVALSGGGIVVEPGVTISNPLMVTSGKLAGSGTVVASSITIGANTILAPGEADAVGTLHFANSLTFGNSGTLQLRLSDTSASGGWDQVQIGGNLAITASSATPFTLQVLPFTAGGLLTSTLPANFNPYTAGSWMVVTAGSITGFNANQFVIDSSAFSSSAMGGAFSLAMNATNTGLMLNFTPVPEPSTYALMLAGIGTMFLVSRRRRRRG